MPFRIRRDRLPGAIGPASPGHSQEAGQDAMILDFAGPDRAALDRPFDVCVVGAGPAGITLARALAARGLDVALMEGGGRRFDPASQDLYRGESVGLPYVPLDATRLRYLGGSSNHWGGRSRALDAHDFEPLPHHPLSGWPIGRADLDPYAAETEAILDLPPPETSPDRRVPGAEDRFLRIRFRFSPPTLFGEKYEAELAASPRITLALNASLVDLRLAPDTLAAERYSVEAAVFRSLAPGDPGTPVRARHHVLAMGGIEIPRALLAARSQLPAGIGNRHDLVGRFFCEHPGIPRLGRILFEGPPPPMAGFAPTPALLAREGALNFNLLMMSRGSTLPREIARDLACLTSFTERLAEEVSGRRIDCDEGGVLAYLAARWRGEARTGSLGLIIEQALNRDSRVILGATRDALGLPVPVLDWQLSALDRHTMRTAALAMGGYLADRGIGRLQLADWLREEDGAAPPPRVDVLHHHMCTTRMSADPREGVVDADGRVHEATNLSLAGSGTFATAGQANPTYTVVQLALRQADRLAAALTRGGF
jgi:hypothetical protein